MKQQSIIPLHDLEKEDIDNISFAYKALDATHDYDSSIRHRHNYYEIFIFLTGGGEHEIDFQSYPIQTNNLHFVYPGQVHRIKRKSNSVGYVLLFSSSFYALNAKSKNLLFELPFLSNNGPNPALALSKKDMQGLTTLLQNIENETKNNKVYQEEVIRAYLQILLLFIHRLYIIKYPESNYIKVSGIHKKFKLLLENNFEKMHKVQEYAKQLSVSEKTLTETIKKLTGKSASEHIFDRIILEAKRLLKNSEEDIKEIAYSLNFHDPSHFSNFFKSKTGLSPNEFRHL